MEDEILIAIGKLAAAPTSSKAPVKPVVKKAGIDANVSLDGDKQNTAHIQSVTLDGEIVPATAKVYKDETKATELGPLKAKDPVRILGASTNFFAIEHLNTKGKPGTGFVKKTDVKLV